MMGSTRGRRNIQRVLQGRIPHLQQQQANLLGEYLYHITVADPSGEFAMNSLLEPVVAPDFVGVFARQPLEDQLVERLEGNNGDVTTSSSIKKIKVLFGDHDWMRPNEPSARNALSKFQKIDASVHILPNAGHHLYLDNNHDFVRHILED
jgi:cardiolipin-specific phospholipase